MIIRDTVIPLFSKTKLGVAENLGYVQSIDSASFKSPETPRRQVTY